MSWPSSPPSRRWRIGTGCWRRRGWRACVRRAPAAPTPVTCSGGRRSWPSAVSSCSAPAECIGPVGPRPATRPRRGRVGAAAVVWCRVVLPVLPGSRPRQQRSDGGGGTAAGGPGLRGDGGAVARAGPGVDRAGVGWTRPGAADHETQIKAQHIHHRWQAGFLSGESGGGRRPGNRVQPDLRPFVARFRSRGRGCRPRRSRRGGRRGRVRDPPR